MGRTVESPAVQSLTSNNRFGYCNNSAASKHAQPTPFRTAYNIILSTNIKEYYIHSTDSNIFQLQSVPNNDWIMGRVESRGSASTTARTAAYHSRGATSSVVPAVSLEHQHPLQRMLRSVAYQPESTMAVIFASPGGPAARAWLMM